MKAEIVLFIYLILYFNVMRITGFAEYMEMQRAVFVS